MHVKEHSWFCQAHNTDMMRLTMDSNDLGIADARGRGEDLSKEPPHNRPMSLLWFNSLDYDLEIREWWLPRFYWILVTSQVWEVKVW